MPEVDAKVEIVPDAQALARRAAEEIVALARKQGGRFAVCLSGGSTPRPLYALLAEAPYRDALPWRSVHWFWGDERYVPWDDPQSNYRMVREAMLARASVPPENVHPIATTPSPADAARAYERELRSFYGMESLDPVRPLFDFTLLGLGEDGHTASLFPGSPVLGERARWVAEVAGSRPEVRITLTYPALESSRRTVFLVAGSEKAAILARALAGDAQLPAARLRCQGELSWLVDAAARGGAA
jgi:6-phosphogluconolactonase